MVANGIMLVTDVSIDATASPIADTVADADLAGR